VITELAFYPPEAGRIAFAIALVVQAC
jgi:hypothetical protein